MREGGGGGGRREENAERLFAEASILPYLMMQLSRGGVSSQY